MEKSFIFQAELIFWSKAGVFLTTSLNVAEQNSRKEKKSIEDSLF